jgi:hypothetical protein
MVFKPSTKTQLKKVRDAHAAILSQIADKEAARNAALLAGDEAAAVAKIDAEIAGLRHADRTEADRIKLLEKEAEKKEGLARAKRQAELIGCVKAKIAEADAIGAEAQAVADKLIKLCFRECELRLAVLPMWAWNNSDRGAIGLSGVAVKERYMRYFYKAGTVINRLGGLPVDRAVPSFPGRLEPRFELKLQPKKIPSMIDDMGERSAYASKVLDAGKRGPMRAVATPKSTVAEGKLEELLKQQAELANDISEEGEKRYRAVVQQITALSYEIATEPEPRPAP